MPSADLDEATATAVKARTINNGQSCIAAKRFIVHEQIYDRFEKGFVEAMKMLTVGDPLDEKIDVGPLATEQILKDLEEQVNLSVARGAKLLTGGKRSQLSGDLAGGHFFQPTVLADIPNDSPASCDETFGPVASLFRAGSVDEAIRIANATTFGLGSSAWTNDEVECRRFIDELEAGSVFINGMVASDPRLPFGGVRNSGYGRELSYFGIREFVNIKTVWIKSRAQGD
jgi:succinate-semialdehyde dehydrogenase/glutarate-semialdehyde dehydrogenase